MSNLIDKSARDKLNPSIIYGRWGKYYELEDGEIQVYFAGGDAHESRLEDMAVCVHAMDERYPYTGLCMSCMRKVYKKHES